MSNVVNYNPDNLPKPFVVKDKSSTESAFTFKIFKTANGGYFGRPVKEPCDGSITHKWQVADRVGETHFIPLPKGECLTGLFYGMELVSIDPNSEYYQIYIATEQSPNKMAKLTNTGAFYKLLKKLPNIKFGQVLAIAIDHYGNVKSFLDEAQTEIPDAVFVDMPQITANWATEKKLYDIQRANQEYYLFSNVYEPYIKALKENEPNDISHKEYSDFEEMKTLPEITFDQMVKVMEDKKMTPAQVLDACKASTKSILTFAVECEFRAAFADELENALPF